MPFVILYSLHSLTTHKKYHMKNSKETSSISFKNCGAIILMTLGYGESNLNVGALLTTIYFTLGKTEGRDSFPIPGYRPGGLGLPNLGILCTLNPEQTSHAVLVHDLLVDTCLSMLGSSKTTKEQLLQTGEDIGVSTIVLDSLFQKLNYFHLQVERIESLSRGSWPDNLEPGLIADMQLDLREEDQKLGTCPDHLLHWMIPDIMRSLFDDTIPSIDAAG